MDLLSTVGIPFIVALLIVGAFIGIYYYTTGILPGSKTIVTTPPIEGAVDENNAKFMFFYTPWCPWCKKAQQPWASMKELIKNSRYTYGGKNVTLEEINCDGDKGKAALYKINSYPTFKVETDKNVTEFSGKPTTKNFREFLIEVLGAEKGN
jgi:thiol-disulfide isomerase/thioredoxin